MVTLRIWGLVNRDFFGKWQPVLSLEDASSHELDRHQWTLQRRAVVAVALQGFVACQFVRTQLQYSHLRDHLGWLNEFHITITFKFYFNSNRSLTEKKQ